MATEYFEAVLMRADNATMSKAIMVAVLQWLGRRSGFFSGISGVVAFSGRRSCVVTDSNFNAGANHRGECVYNAGDSSHPSSHEA